MTAQQDDRAPLSREAQPLADLSTKREGVDADTLALETARAIEGEFERDHLGGDVQRRARIQCHIIAALASHLTAALASQAPARPQDADYRFTSSQLADYVDKCRAAWEAQRAQPQPVDASGEVLGYAQRLALALWGTHWSVDAPEWKPLPDLMGVLTQIDNMTVGLSRPQAFPAREGEKAAPTVDETLDFIMRAHSGQVDKIGEPYWKHPARVMARIPNATDHERIVALLHDVLEDTHYTALDLLKMGYPVDVVWDVNTLTKPKNAVPYRYRIKTIAALGSQAAIRVKIADVEDNLDPPRFSKLQEQDQHRLGEKYQGAIEVLKAALPAAPSPVIAEPGE